MTQLWNVVYTSILPLQLFTAFVPHAMKQIESVNTFDVNC